LIRAAEPEQIDLPVRRARNLRVDRRQTFLERAVELLQPEDELVPGYRYPPSQEYRLRRREGRSKLGRTTGLMFVDHRLAAPSRLKQMGDILQPSAKRPVQTAAAFRTRALIHVLCAPVAAPTLRTSCRRPASSCIHP